MLVTKAIFVFGISHIQSSKGVHSLVEKARSSTSTDEGKRATYEVVKRISPETDRFWQDVNQPPRVAWAGGDVRGDILSTIAEGARVEGQVDKVPIQENLVTQSIRVIEGNRNLGATDKFPAQYNGLEQLYTRDMQQATRDLLATPAGQRMSVDELRVQAQATAQERMYERCLPTGNGPEIFNNNRPALIYL